MREGRLPARPCIHESLCRARAWSVVLGRSSCANRVDRGAGGSRNADAVRVVLKAAFDAIPRRQESVEPLDEVGVAGKELRNPADDTRRVDSDLG